MSIQCIGTAPDRVMAALVSGLAREFGRDAGEALARRFIHAEEVDFHWDARISERWLGSYDGTYDDEEVPLDRVAIWGRLDRGWFAAVCIVDGEGRPHGIAGLRNLASESAARQAYAGSR